MDTLRTGQSDAPAQLDTIPDDVWTSIICLLSILDICSLSACSRRWRLHFSSDFVWLFLYQKRWHLLEPRDEQLKGGDMLGLPNVQAESDFSCKSWRDMYICSHKKMESGAAAIIDYVKKRSTYDSVEVAEYQKAMALLISSGLGFVDVQTFLLIPKHSVLVNLLGLHYCLGQLKMQKKDVREALVKNNICKRQVCLRWWSLGSWTSGFRKHDEMHIQIASLINLTESKSQFFLEVIDRGILHEVLRVQISADFESSAWVARSMHSQR